MQPELSINCILKTVELDPKQPCKFSRILWLDPGADLVATYEVTSPLKGLPAVQPLSDVMQKIASGELLVTSIKPRRVQLLPEDKIDQSYKDVRDYGWQLIQPLVDSKDSVKLFDRESRGVLVRTRAKECKIGKNQVYAVLRRYWAYGQVKDALFPDWEDSGPRGQQPTGTAKRGRKPLQVLLGLSEEGIALGDCRGLLEKGARLFHVGKATIPDSYKKTVDTYFNNGFERQGGLLVPILKPERECPTVGQYAGVLAQLDKTLRVTRRKGGENAYNLKLRPIEKAARYGVFGPGARYEIDSTILDIYLVSSFNRRWIIGRPVLYVVVDVFSRMVVGFYLGLEGPSWASARLALANAFTDKTEFCAKRGINITLADWPACHIPHKVLADRGEMICVDSDELARSLHVIVEQTPPRRPDWKPFVERDFGLITQGTIIFLPGAVDQRDKERRQRDYRLDACFTLEELEEILIDSFLEFNEASFQPKHLPEEMIADGFTDATPNGLWAWGMENLTGHARRESDDLIRVKLLPRGEGRVHPDGIWLNGVRYICETARTENWLGRARKNKSWKVPLRYDSTTDRVWLQHESDGHLEQCIALEPDLAKAPRRFEEIADKIAVLNLAEAEKHTQNRQKGAARRARVKALTTAATQEAADAREGLANSQVVAAISDNRRLEKNTERLERLKEEALSILPPAAADAVQIPPSTKADRGRRSSLLTLIDDAWDGEKREA